MASMYTEEYLAAVVGGINIAMSCKDVLNVYRQPLKLARTQGQSDIFPGVTLVANEIMPVIDLRRRSGMSSHYDESEQNIIAFQTSVTQKYAVIVDEIIGMKTFLTENVRKANKDLGNKDKNLNLLFPMIALTTDGVIYHILDATYLDKIDPIAEESGDLELF